MNRIWSLLLDPVFWFSLYFLLYRLRYFAYLLFSLLSLASSERSLVKLEQERILFSETDCRENMIESMAAFTFPSSRGSAADSFLILPSLSRLRCRSMALSIEDCIDRPISVLEEPNRLQISFAFLNSFSVRQALIRPSISTLMARSSTADALPNIWKRESFRRLSSLA